MLNCVTQILRKPASTLLLISLLVISIITSSVGFSAWVGSHEQFQIIDNQYTTIGIHSGLNYEKHWENGLQRPTGKDSTRFDDGTVYTGPIDAHECAKDSSAYVSSANCILLGAHIDGSTGLTSGTMNILDYIETHDSTCYQLSVLAIECTAVEEINFDWGGWETYQITGTIIDDVCLMDAYNLPPENDTIYIQSSLYTSEGEIPFEVGKTYLVRGRYMDYVINDLGFETTVDNDGTEKVTWVRGRDIENGARQLVMEGDGALVQNMATPGRADGVQNWVYDILISDETDNFYFVTPENDCWPYYAEYTGDWRSFLNSENGAVWRDEIIPNFEMNHASAPVILTDNISSMYLFNTGDASILEGREFSESEYLNGDPVCLVSASYAKLNHLRIGDTINLDYYDTGFTQTECVISSIKSKLSLTVERKPLTEDTRMDIQMDYTIVGIYTSPEWTPGVQNFHADTIFVPKSSVPGIDNYSGDTMAMLNSIIIKNGSINEFEDYMAQNNMAGVYLYFDQGYSEAATSVRTLINNAVRLLVVGVAIFVLASLLFMLLFIRRTAPVIRSMRLLGISVKQTWRESFGTLLVQEILAVILGNILSILLYDQITTQLLSGVLKLSMGSIILCSVVQLGLLITVGSIWTHSVARRNLMQKG